MKLALVLRMLIVGAALSIVLGCSGKLKQHEVFVIKKTHTYHRRRMSADKHGKNYDHDCCGG